MPDGTQAFSRHQSRACWVHVNLWRPPKGLTTAPKGESPLLSDTLSQFVRSRNADGCLDTLAVVPLLKKLHIGIFALTDGDAKC